MSRQNATHTSVMSRFGTYAWPWGKYPPQPSELVAFAQEAERLGFDSIHLSYHAYNPTNWIFAEFPQPQYIVDPLAFLPYLIAKTKHIKLSTMAIPLPLFNPYLNARYTAICDQLSGGRMIFSAVTGWFEKEFQLVGEDVKKRGKQSDEALHIITDLLTTGHTSFKGDFYSFEDHVIDPLPVQRPRPPIWVAGESDAAIRRAVQFSDLMLMSWPSPEQADEFVHHKFPPLFERFGRRTKLAGLSYVVIADSDEWVRENAYPVLDRAIRNPARPDEQLDLDAVAIAGTPEKVAQKMNDLFAAGIEYFVLDFNYHGVESLAFASDQMRRFSREVVPLLRL